MDCDAQNRAKPPILRKTVAHPVLRDLEQLHRSELLADIDLHFARFIARLDARARGPASAPAGSAPTAAEGPTSQPAPKGAGGDPAAVETVPSGTSPGGDPGAAADPQLLLAAALASHATGEGHVCIDLRAIAGGAVLETPDRPALSAPPLEPWLAALRRSPVVGEPGDFRPLVLDGAGRLYLHRYWDYEREVAEALLERAGAEADGIDETALRAGLDRLFAEAPEVAPDWQRIAAAVAALKRLCVISGGPGTGKTSTVIRILALLLEQAGDRPCHIALAAPTGKAAARMQEAIRRAREALAVDEGIRARIPDRAATLHRLLGARPDSVYFRHDRRNPLPADVVVVDEASMVDLALMAKLMRALRPEARLILLGDKDQLASVEAGAVLGDICGGPGGFSAPFRARLESLTGRRLNSGEEGPPAAGEGGPLADSIVLLRHSYRFGADSGIGRLAGAVVAGDAARAGELLRAGVYPDIVWSPLQDPTLFGQAAAGRLVEGFGSYLRLLAEGAKPEAVFQAFNRFRILCPHRAGAAGVSTLNPLVAAILDRAGLLEARHLWYPGRPVMITRNHYELHLFNGDLGIAMPDPEAGGALRVFFEAEEGGLRRYSPARLPEHETCYALTVHKSQGSEFDEVLLLLPAALSPVLTRELLYTALTRARSRVEIWGPDAVVREATARATRRSSGLRDTLWPA